MNIKQPLMKAVRFGRQKPFDALLILVLAGVILKLLALYTSVEADDENWEQFIKENGCRPLTDETSALHAKWQCKDGEVYYRWRQQR